MKTCNEHEKYNVSTCMHGGIVAQQVWHCTSDL